VVTKSTKKGSKKSRAKTVKRSTKRSTPAKKAAKKAAAKSTKGARRKTRPTRAIAGTTISSIQLVAYDGPDAEDNITCRPKSTLNIDAIIKRVDTDTDPTDGRLRLTFVINDPHAIFFNVPNCNPDAFVYIPQNSSNIASIGGPEYLGTPIKKIRVKIFSPNPLKVIPIPFTLGFRLRFEENFNLTQQFNPKKKRCGITVL
jgi:hypothetical protein